MTKITHKLKSFYNKFNTKARRASCDEENGLKFNTTFPTVAKIDQNTGIISSIKPGKLEKFCNFLRFLVILFSTKIF